MWSLFFFKKKKKKKLHSLIFLVSFSQMHLVIHLSVYCYCLVLAGLLIVVIYLVGQLNWCFVTDARPIIIHILSVSTGGCPFNMPKSSSLDPFIDSSFSIKPNTSSPCKIFVQEQKNIDQATETSYLVIGSREMRKEHDYVNYQGEDKELSQSKIISTGTEKSCFVSPVKNCPVQSDKPETLSNSTAFTVAPSVSSSSSPGPSSVCPLSPLCMDHDLKSPSSLHDSNISRLIDAVSLNNEQESHGSISALIGQFESTVNQSNLTIMSHNTPPLCPLNANSSPTPQDLSFPVRANTAPTNEKALTSPHQADIEPGVSSQAEGTTCALFPSPETAELEEVYTILNEEVLLPVSVCNQNKSTVHESTLSKIGLSPVKAVHSRDKDCLLVWNDMHKKRDGIEKIEEAEESVYEEVDPPMPVHNIEWSSSKKYTDSSANRDCFQFRHDSTRNSFSEVELNVDEDPHEIASHRHKSRWEELRSPTKQNTMYRNQESTPNYNKQKQPSSYCDYQQWCLSHASNVALSPFPSPKTHQLSNNHQQHSNFQPSPFDRPANVRTPNPSLFRPKNYPYFPRDSETSHNSGDFNRTYDAGSYQDRLGYKKIDLAQLRSFNDGLYSSESLAQNDIRDRRPFSPPPDCDAVYSYVDYDCYTPKVEFPQTTQSYTQSQTQSPTPKQSWNQKVSITNQVKHQLRPDSTVSFHSNVGSNSVSGITDSASPSTCKSKSLGDLTSEDISCNFQSKYRIISRSFITHQMRKQRMRGALGEGTYQSQSCDPLTEQLRKLVSLEGDERDSDIPQEHLFHQATDLSWSNPQTTSAPTAVPRDADDSPPPLTRRLSSRSQSRVRHINSRARERQQEALKPRTGAVINGSSGIGGVVMRNKPTSQCTLTNRHSTGSYIAGYYGQLEDRGLPEGSCTSLHHRNGNSYGDLCCTDDSLPPADSIHSASEPEVYFLLRL